MLEIRDRAILSQPHARGIAIADRRAMEHPKHLSIREEF
jgi:hypothetical protein